MEGHLKLLGASLLLAQTVGGAETRLLTSQDATTGEEYLRDVRNKFYMYAFARLSFFFSLSLSLSRSVSLSLSLSLSMYINMQPPQRSMDMYLCTYKINDIIYVYVNGR